MTAKKEDGAREAADETLNRYFAPYLLAAKEMDDTLAAPLAHGIPARLERAKLSIEHQSLRLRTVLSLEERALRNKLADEHRARVEVEAAERKKDAEERRALAERESRERKEFNDAQLARADRQEAAARQEATARGKSDGRMFLLTLAIMAATVAQAATGGFYYALQKYLADHPAPPAACTK